MVLTLHWRAIRKAGRRLDESLSSLPEAPAPPPRPRKLQTLEIIALMLVGPGLILDLAGTLFPHLFDNTPFKGRQLEPFGLLGVAALVTILVAARWRRLKARRAA